MKNVLSKLSLARVYVKSHPLKKDGRNEFSKYDYFTPEIVSKLVNEACNETNIICIFSLKQDTLGYFGEVATTDLETGETLITEMRTEKPVITATNATQQMGGMNTYTKRYCLMSLFDIEDNTIDFDNQDNSKPTTKAQSSPNQQTNGTKVSTGAELPWLNEGTKEFDGAVKKLRAGTTTIEKIKAVFRISKAIDAKLKEAMQQPASN
jgi:hypothetical protein